MPFLREIIELPVAGDARIHSVTPAANRAGTMRAEDSESMRTRAIIAFLAAFAALAVSAPAAAHGRGRVTFGLHIGVPLGYYGYYPPPYYYFPYYPPSVVVVPREPTTYIERDSAPSSDAQSYWYYCPDSSTYYPYVKQCPGGWQKVPPRPQ